MAGKKNGLGKGLDSLIPDKKPRSGRSTATGKASAATSTKARTAKAKAEEANENGAPLMVPITKVEPNQDQPRRHFDEDALLELSESLKQYGILSPLLVQKKDDYYEIIAGERRWRAAKIAELKEVPVIVRDLSSQEVVEISLIENIQREDLNPIEEAMAYKRLLDEFHMKQDEVAERVSKSRAAVTNSIRLLKLDQRVQQMVIDEMISTGHARAILGITGKDRQYELAQRVFDEKMSVREVEKEVKRIQEGGGKKKNTEQSNAITDQIRTLYDQLEENLKVTLGTKVKIHPKDSQKGKLEIEYYSQDELERIIDLIHRGQ